MRRYVTCVVLLAFLLFAMGVMAQTSSSSDQQRSTTTTTTTTQQNPSSDTSQTNPSQSSQGSTMSQHEHSSTAQSSATAGERAIEGCLAKEGPDFFLIPAHGNPIELQASAGQDLSAHAGHKVKVRGTESSLSAAGTTATSSTGGGAAGTMTSSTATTSGAGTQTGSGSVNEPAGSTSSSTQGAASGTGNDLHRLATKQMSVSNLDHIAETCPVNWNPKVMPKSGSSKY